MVSLNIVEMAHGYHPSMKKYIVDDLGMVNSFDTWHGKHAHMYFDTLFHLVTFCVLVHRDQACPQGNCHGIP